jgi:hypothetical protein
MSDSDHWLDDAIAQFSRSGESRQLRQRDYQIDAPWLGDQGRQALHAVYLLQRDDRGVAVRAFVTDQPPAIPPRVEDEHAFAAIAQTCGAAVLDLGEPLALAPVAIPKPWGQELWFTGIERRGLSAVEGSTGRTPLPWALSIGLGMPTTPVLLKILDPWPDPIYGDLYLELHAVKEEVYVVTHLDADAWPQGVGAIRYGISSEIARGYDAAADLRGDFLEAVRAYEHARRRVDAAFEAKRAAAGISPHAPVSPALQRSWHSELPPELQDGEARLRKRMDQFTELHPLRVGDVLAIPPGAPHALQHGVRVVEFQTPVYERQIIAFSQKVLTQDHWDSASAIASMSLEGPGSPTLTLVVDDGGCTAERIARFSDFAVWRVRLAPGAAIRLPEQLTYALCMSVQGQITIGRLTCTPEQACLMPPKTLTHPILNAGADFALFLVAAPGI